MLLTGMNFVGNKRRTNWEAAWPA